MLVVDYLVVLDVGVYWLAIMERQEREKKIVEISSPEEKEKGVARHCYS